MEMLYPPPITYPVGCNDGCLHGAVNNLISREDGSVTTYWTERGGLNSPLISPQTGGQVNSLGTSTFASGTTTASFDFPTVRSPGQRHATSALLNSTAYHTAMVSSIVGID
jgi:hypothetical protein